jgi:phage terminase small subunit
MTRGRKNADRERHRARKPKPPGSLTPAESEIWTKVCASQDGAWCELASTSGLLEFYCIARAYYDLLVARRRVLLAPPEDADGPVVPNLTLASGVSEEINKQSAEVVRLARALRLTHQSRQEPKGTKNSPPDPWASMNDGDDEDDSA